MPKKRPALYARPAKPTKSTKSVPPAAKATPVESRPDRAGRRLLGAHVPEAAYRQFRLLAAEEGTNNHELLREAINDLFRKRGKDPVA
jgi:hypothetical protein